MKKIFVVTAPAFLLTSCSVLDGPLDTHEIEYLKTLQTQYIENANELEMSILKYSRLLEEKKQEILTIGGCALLNASDNYAACVDTAIRSISNDFVKKCILANLETNTELFSRMQEATISNGDVKLIESLENECIYQNELGEPQETGSGQAVQEADNTIPLFLTFATAAAGAYVASYLANTQFSDYVKSIEKNRHYYWQNKYYGTTGPGFVYGRDKKRKKKGEVGAM